MQKNSCDFASGKSSNRSRLKGAFSIVACFALILLTVAGCQGTSPGKSPDCVLASAGTTPYVITLARDATPPERHAAEELAEFLFQVTGATFPIKLPDDAGAAPRLAVGSGAAKALEPNISLDGLGADGIVIRQTASRGADSGIILTGGSGAPRGTLYAVYTFLEDQVGCRWWTRSESSIPRKSTLAVPAGLDVRYVPILERRDQCFVEGLEKDWSVRMKYNGWCGPGDDVARGGSLGFAGPNCHTFYPLVPPQEHFAKHPEWFSEIKGVRVAKEAQLCLTNPELTQFVITRVKQWIQENPQAAYVSVTQNDYQGWCTCAKCKAVDDAEGGQSGTMIRFVNAVAEAIEKEYPNVAVDSFAYQYTRKPPKLTKPRKNVVVRLCSIECDFAHPLDDERNKAFREDIEGWARICDRLYVWDYVTNFGHYLQAHPNLRVLGPNIRFFVKHNVKGVFEQGNYQSLGGEFGALRAWMMGKLLWNPELDDKVILDEFLDGYYGPAAPSLRDYINLIHDTVEKADFTMTCGTPTTAPYVAPEILAQSAKLFEQAKSAAAGQPDYLRRVEIAEMSLLYSLIDKEYNLLTPDGKMADEKTFLAHLDRFEAIAVREKITHISEGGEQIPLWLNRIRRQAVAVNTDEGTGQTNWTAKTVRGDVNVTRLSAFWKFAPDPKDAGVAGNWFGEGFDDALWVKNRNDLDCGWERQGFPGYTGFGWYRQKFDLPADLKQKHVYLHFGAVDEDAWIYLNGESKTAFEHTCASTKLVPDQIWNTPFMFDTSDRLKAGQSNLLAVRVYNVAAMGGLWRPVYVIACDTELTLKDAEEAVKQEPKK